MRKGFSCKDFGIVFHYYFKKEIKSKVYIIVTVLLCIVSFASCFFLNLFLGEKNKSSLYIVDRTGLFFDSLSDAEIPKDYFQGVFLDFTADKSLSDDSIVQGVKEQERSYAVFSSENGEVRLTLYDSGKVSAADAQALLNLSQTLYQRINMEQAGISPEVFENANRQILYDKVNPVQKQKTFWTTYILYMLMVVAIVMYSSSSGSEVAYLKTNKVMEIVTTSIKPLPFYLGVTLSIGLSGLLQLAAIVVCFLISSSWPEWIYLVFSDMGVTLSALQPDEIAAFLLLFIGGFLLYSFVNTAIASIVNRNDDLTVTVGTCGNAGYGTVFRQYFCVGIRQCFVGRLFLSSGYLSGGYVCAVYDGICRRRRTGRRPCCFVCRGTPFGHMRC